ncbi:MAG: zinc ABC transporter substrate-binding protein [Pirellulales bacterium]|nr:zinc ABC transporter substrate-binding protein [Pirellulales bacterium]
MVADLVRAVGGAHVKVVQLMGPGIDPHLYKASPGDVDALTNADMVVFSGLHLEGKLADLFERMACRKPTIGVAEVIAPDRLLRASGGAVDPHVWFDVALWRETVMPLAEALARFDPPHAEDYRQRATAYAAQFDALDAWCRSRVETLPPNARILVTAHDAFHYFGRAYGLEVRAIQGISTESEAGVREINQLVDFLVARKVKAVFVEASVNERNVRALVEGADARGQAVRIGGELFSDAPGAAGTDAASYLGMVRHNVDTIVNALK